MLSHSATRRASLPVDPPRIRAAGPGRPGQTGPVPDDDRCPKRMEYGPCGGVRDDLTCEMAARPCPFAATGEVVAWSGSAPRPAPASALLAAAPAPPGPPPHPPRRPP